MSFHAIDIQNLTKVYAGNGKAPPKKALDDVSLQVKKGSIFGLLGPNGAGKSTLINIMAGLVHKTAGQVNIWDFDIEQNPRNAKSAIGIVPQEINYDPFFSPIALLDLMAGLYGVPKSERKSMDLLKFVGLEDKANAYTRSLSGGMKRRLMVAKAMVHSPPVLVLDEPTAGVDVELRRQLWANIQALNEQGTTIILTTHYLEEAEALCDEIAIINQGKIIAHEPTRDLIARIDSKEIRFTLSAPITALPPALDQFCAEIANNNEIRVRYCPTEHSVDDIINALHHAGLHIQDITTRDSKLEDVFVQLTSNIAA